MGGIPPPPSRTCWSPPGGGRPAGVGIAILGKGGKQTLLPAGLSACLGAAGTRLRVSAGKSGVCFLGRGSGLGNGWGIRRDESCQVRLCAAERGHRRMRRSIWDSSAGWDQRQVPGGGGGGGGRDSGTPWALQCGNPPAQVAFIPFLCFFLLGREAGTAQLSPPRLSPLFCVPTLAVPGVFLSLVALGPLSSDRALPSTLLPLGDFS